MGFAKAAAGPESGVLCGGGRAGTMEPDKGLEAEWCLGDRSSGRVKEGTGALGKRKELGLVTVRPCPRGVQGERRRRFELGGLGT